MLGAPKKRATPKKWPIGKAKAVTATARKIE